MERELKQLARAELVEILYAQQKENEALKAENAKLRALLDERELHISTAGSIAEAALQVNHVYETAQEAADQYLRSIRRLEKDLKERTADAEQEKAEILRRTPCRYSGSAYRDDLILLAHNYESHFGRLKSLSPGDAVLFTDADGNEFAYEVLELEMLRPTAVEDMTAGDWDLTLFTCTLGGQARVTVRCLRTDRS